MLLKTAKRDLIHFSMALIEFETSDFGTWCVCDGGDC